MSGRRKYFELGRAEKQEVQTMQIVLLAISIETDLSCSPCFLYLEALDRAIYWTSNFTPEITVGSSEQYQTYCFLLICSLFSVQVFSCLPILFSLYYFHNQ